MKNTVDDIIRTFNKEEFREFKYFLNRQNNHTHEREDLKILDYIRKNETDKITNKLSYHQTKNRLKRQLELFAAMENVRFENSSKIQGKVEMAKYLFRKNLHHHAWDYLLKAEQMATQAEEYELLNYIYYIQISYSYNIAISPPGTFSVPNLLDKRNLNLSSAKLDGDANAAYAMLINELRERFARQLNVDIDALVKTIFDHYGLDDKIIQHDNLKIYYKIVNIVCRALREKRDYENLKKYSINSYEIIKQYKRDEQDSSSTEYMLNLLDMICIGALRSRDYENYELFQTLYAEEARKMMASPDEFSYYDFIPAIDAADLYMCTNRLELARKSLLTVKKKYGSYTGSVRIYFLLRVNLIAMHFKSNEYQQCILLYNEIQTMGEKKILTERGFRLDLILLTDIYAAIFYYEIEDFDHAFYLISKLKRKYNTLLKTEDSQREISFIKILEKMVNDASYRKSKMFNKEVDKFIAMRAFDPGDNEYISLNAWLESKKTGRSYYACFLDLVK